MTGGPGVVPATAWVCGDRRFDVRDRPLVMGVLNVTPDSFSDGGRYVDPETALAHARSLLAEGADLLDVGAESTRPGALPVADDVQWARLEPVIEPLAREGVCVSVDTASAAVAARALQAGARVVNDVSALADPGMAAAVAGSGAGLVLMHMQGTPATMQDDPHYDDVCAEVISHLLSRATLAEAAGVARDHIALDPGIGFGKTVAHNLALIAAIGRFAAHGYPVLVGISRKGFLGRLTGDPVAHRIEAGLAAAAVAVFEGARIVRTHDVAATVRALRVAEALRRARV